jgi:hypothetical protein
VVDRARVKRVERDCERQRSTQLSAVISAGDQVSVGEGATSTAQASDEVEVDGGLSGWWRRSELKNASNDPFAFKHRTWRL